jgi:acetyl esterase/lipase
MIFFQGLDDKVVPPQQSEVMVEALRTRGVPVAYMTLEGEGHGFRKADSIVRTLEAELYFYLRVFGMGLVPDGTPGASGCTAYWGVADAQAELARLTAMGAQVHEEVTDVGEGIRVASVRDPFGNVFGIIQNPHFDASQLG